MPKVSCAGALTIHGGHEWAPGARFDCVATIFGNFSPIEIVDRDHGVPNFVRDRLGVVDIDSIDQALLRELQDDARQTNRELASKAGVSPSTSLERVRSMRENGIITGYHAAVDLEAVGRPVQALISVRIRPPARPIIEGFREWAARLPETIGLFVTSGSHDFLIHIAVPDINGVYAFVIDRLTERREVADVHTTMVYEHVRSRRIDPADGRRRPR